MKKIDLNHYPRRALFEVFKNRDVPHFSLTAPVDITLFKTFVDAKRCGFFVALSFLISTAVNRVPELRHRLIAGELYEFERVDPGFTVLLDDRTFSFCDAQHFENFALYRSYAEEKIQAVRKCPDLGSGEKHHMFFITNLPWISFTSITHPYDKQYASIPVISLGKFFQEDGRLLIPVGIQVHHGLVDGIHVGDFYAHLAALCQTPGDHLS
ncbi:MAG: CatA-like O-acetyltransferase [Gammaproteobacteria bacterium]